MPAQPPKESQHARRALLGEIEREAALILPVHGIEPLSGRVKDAIARVPRECFVPRSGRAAAYDDCPLYIGYGQTISQPFIVALMTHLLQVGPEDRVLEVGTGSGYQAAVLGEVVGEVYSMEVVTPLAEIAQARLVQLGYDNVHVRVGDGSHGWPEHAPYDGIIVTAAGPCIPEALIGQLRPGARLVMPVGDRLGSQWLEVLRKDEQGVQSRWRIIPVRFVPLTSAVIES